MNGAPRNAREELIAELEGLGYDTMPGVREDWADWRERLSDDDMRTIIRNITDPASREDALDRAEMAVAEAFDAAQEDAGEADFPDISEMVEAMRGTVSAADAWLAANPAIVEDATPEWEAWNRSFTALRDLVARIDAASASAFGGDDA